MTDMRWLKSVITPSAKKHGVARMWLFGSRARGTDNAGSDYDFLISKGNIKSLIRYMSFIDDLEDALGTHVDVVMDTSEDQAFIDKIRKEQRICLFSEVNSRIL